MSQPDPLARDLLDLVLRALSIDPSPYEEATLARLLLYSDHADVAVLAGLITRAREHAARSAVEGWLS
jgi:hypothetical protein